MIIDEEDYLEHYGVAGMKWGIRKAASGAKAVGRGTKKTAKFAYDHKKATLVVGSILAAGVSYAAMKNSNSKALGKQAISNLDLNTPFKYKIDGSPWMTTLPRTSLAEATRGLR